MVILENIISSYIGMTWKSAFLLTICLVAIYFFIYKIVITKWRRDKANKLINMSNGTADEPAMEAVRELERLDNPNARDHYAMGNLIRYNLLNNVIAPGIGMAIRNYARAVDRLEADDELAPFILHDAAEFAGQIMMMQMIEAQNAHNRLIIVGGDDIMEDLHQLTQTNGIRRESAEQRMERAASTSETRREAISKYFDESTVYRNDPQNVHDSKVSSDLRETLARIKQTYNSDVGTDLAEIKMYINGTFAEEHPNSVISANTALNKIKLGEYISTYKDSEDNILAYVWGRAKDRRNADKSDLIKESIALALADAAPVSRAAPLGSVVCINGRVARILGSLALVDYDPSVGSALTFDAYKNQIYQETKEIIEEAIDEGKKSDNANERAAAEAYEMAEDSESDSDYNVKFREKIKNKIDANLALYSSKLADWELKNIREDCYMYATI